MALRKKNRSKISDLSVTRKDGMEVIDTKEGSVIDYGKVGNVLTSVTVAAQIALVELKQADYDKIIDTANAKNVEYQAELSKLSLMYSGVLKGVVSKFGADSAEVEIVGGTRISKRKRPVRKPKPPVP